MDGIKEIVKRIDSMSGRHSPYSIFYDFVKSAALSMWGIVETYNVRLKDRIEKEYLATIGKYKPEEVEVMAEMLGLLTISLQDSMEDVLGKVYMESGAGNKSTGQFFTPFHIAELCAKLGIDLTETKKWKRPMVINEPSCGGGANVIAACKALKEMGINYQTAIRVKCQDLDWLCVYMCYLQLGLLGCKGEVVQIDTLANTQPDERHILKLPGTFL